RPCGPDTAAPYGRKLLRAGLNARVRPPAERDPRGGRAGPRHVGHGSGPRDLLPGDDRVSGSGQPPGRVLRRPAVVLQARSVPRAGRLRAAEPLGAVARAAAGRRGAARALEVEHQPAAAVGRVEREVEVVVGHRLYLAQPLVVGAEPLGPAPRAPPERA